VDRAALIVRPLVLLHGIGTGPSGWEPQVEALAVQRPVLVPDLVPAYRRGLDGAVDEVRQLVSEFPAVELCGISLGGLVALCVAGERGNSDDRLIVCAAFERLPPGLRRRTRALSLVVRLVPRRVAQRQLAAEIPAEHRPGALAELEPFRSRELARLMWQAAGVVIGAVAIRAPTVVVCGERDEANLPLARSLAQALPEATLEVLPGAGHVANLDQPQAFSALLSSE
jgi:3-oxoadipate enol-lactonase